MFFQGERERVQKKTFTKWVNSHLIRVESRVNELYQDLKDGRKLIMLLEILSGEKIVSGTCVCVRCFTAFVHKMNCLLCCFGRENLPKEE